MTAAEIREKLAYAYRIIAHFGWDDWTYTHISARLPGENAFYILPFGFLFEEVTPQSLLKVDLDGNVLEGKEAEYNRTGYVIHGEIYKKRQDLNAIFHLHTIAGVAVSAMACGLLPISQFALHFYEGVTYHDYDALALENDQGGDLASSLKDKKVMFLKNHGTITTGQTIEEAFFYTRHLENACQVQLKATATGQALTIPTPEICEKSVQNLLNFENPLGVRDWKAAVRCIQRANPW